ncbi:unnamed protein product [Paramecium primaurelia]|uniref:Uncharacterized protein n=1 Tax=Paramecium primaurelia TaxID=5886 RepID=A0A8S1MXU0_PARPR|nr:unnamed protein product [Paramecium primaurelia]
MKKQFKNLLKYQILKQYHLFIQKKIIQKIIIRFYQRLDDGRIVDKFKNIQRFMNKLFIIIVKQKNENVQLNVQDISKQILMIIYNQHSLQKLIIYQINNIYSFKNQRDLELFKNRRKNMEFQQHLKLMLILIR